MTIEATLAEMRAELAEMRAEIANLETPIIPLAYKVPQAARALAVDETIVYDLIRDGHLEAVVYPGMSAKRVSVAAVERFLESLERLAA